MFQWAQQQLKLGKKWIINQIPSKIEIIFYDREILLAAYLTKNRSLFWELQTIHDDESASACSNRGDRIPTRRGRSDDPPLRAHPRNKDVSNVFVICGVNEININKTIKNIWFEK